MRRPGAGADPASRRSGDVLRRIFVALLLTAAAVAAIPAWVQLNRGEGPLPDDADLRVERPVVPDEENAFLPLVAAIARLAPQDEREESLWREAVVGGARDPRTARDLVDANTAALDGIPAILQRERFQTPAFERVLDDLELRGQSDRVRRARRVRSASGRPCSPGRAGA